jgi:CheY-like chemotaxis protein
MPDKTKLLIQVLKKIPIFDGLPPSQVRRLLSMCDSRPVAEGAVVCQSDTPSDEMYILLAGELAVTTAEGMRVATVKPVTTVGEMGVITGQPRSATVMALRDSRVLVLKKGVFEAALEEDRSLRIRVFRNFISVLAEKVTNDNMRLREFESERQRFAGLLAGAEREVKEEEKRLVAVLEYMADEGLLKRDEAEAEVTRRVRERLSRVLVVDDEADFRELVVDALPYFAVLQAEDGGQALEVVEQESPDLVITDIMLPGEDGIALAEKLHEGNPELPVLAVSGYVDESEVEGKGFSGFMAKPLKVSEFRELVETALGIED